MGLIIYSAHSAVRRKRLSPKTDVISHSKLDSYHDDLPYVHVINSSHNWFLRCVSFVVASSTRLAGYDKTCTTCISHFAVNHSNPLLPRTTKALNAKGI